MSPAPIGGMVMPWPRAFTPREAMAELLGAVTGCSGGRGGTMHLYDPTVGFLGSNGVVPPGILIASGRGIERQAERYRPGGCRFLRRRGIEQRRLPRRFEHGRDLAAPGGLCLREQSICDRDAFLQGNKEPHVASRAAAYGMPGLQVDGNNVLEVYQKAGEAIDRARAAGEGQRCWNA